MQRPAVVLYNPAKRFFMTMPLALACHPVPYLDPNLYKVIIIDGGDWKKIQ